LKRECGVGSLSISRSSLPIFMLVDFNIESTSVD
jgi:hypothetical protein